jgi:hypothetical protein
MHSVNISYYYTSSQLYCQCTYGFLQFADSKNGYGSNTITGYNFQYRIMLSLVGYVYTQAGFKSRVC